MKTLQNDLMQPEYGLPFSSLAERVGISQPAVQKMASGKLAEAKMVEIARALKVDLNG
jgi:Mn-dependent DtxR family transcriptional regulator